MACMRRYYDQPVADHAMCIWPVSRSRESKPQYARRKRQGCVQLETRPLLALVARSTSDIDAGSVEPLHYVAAVRCLKGFNVPPVNTSVSRLIRSRLSTTGITARCGRFDWGRYGTLVGRPRLRSPTGWSRMSRRRFLSGGIDSSIVAALPRSIIPIDTFRWVSKMRVTMNRRTPRRGGNYRFLTPSFHV